jgi:hypothetical protein
VTRNAELLDMLAPQFDLELQQRAGKQDSFLELVRGTIQPLWLLKNLVAVEKRIRRQLAGRCYPNK